MRPLVMEAKPFLIRVFWSHCLQCPNSLLLSPFGCTSATSKSTEVSERDHRQRATSPHPVSSPNLGEQVPTSKV